MHRVTRNIEPTEARDLLERVPRASVSFASEEGPCAEPATFSCTNERYLAAIASNATRRPAVGQEVVLLIDEGVHFFDLRAIYVRGVVEPVEGAERDDLFWFSVTPTKVVAWDYGRLREEDDAP
jgi:hypothetical protein